MDEMAETLYYSYTWMNAETLFAYETIKDKKIEVDAGRIYEMTWVG